jgi:mono/diheme cytochrome c family protein
LTKTGGIAEIEHVMKLRKCLSIVGGVVLAVFLGETFAPAIAADEIPAMRAKRHNAFLRDGIPLEYRDLTNPYPVTTMVVEDGGKLYAAHCARCHGADGQGGGEAANDLRTPPAILAYMVQHPRSVDEYMLWSIAEGGKEFGTAMPAFKGVLTEREIWQIVTFMRATFPDVGSSTQN